jgi:hypothetical protein
MSRGGLGRREGRHRGAPDTVCVEYPTTVGELIEAWVENRELREAGEAL